MTKEEMKYTVYSMMKEDYYARLKALESDIVFFRLYMERNSKSEFSFDLRVSCGSSYKAFDAIWKKYGYLRDELETAFAEFMLLKSIIRDIYDKTNKFTESQMKDFIEYFERYDETFVEDYVGDFIGCSRGCQSVMSELEKIKQA